MEVEIPMKRVILCETNKSKIGIKGIYTAVPYRDNLVRMKGVFDYEGAKLRYLQSYLTLSPEAVSDYERLEDSLGLVIPYHLMWQIYPRVTPAEIAESENFFEYIFTHPQDVVDLHYIIDTKGHLDSAQISDNEDLSELDDRLVNLKEAVLSVLQMMSQDVIKYNRDMKIVRVISLDVYGYGNYSVHFETPEWGNRQDLFNTSHNLVLKRYFTEAGSREFTRRFLRDLRAALAEPIKH